MLGTFFYVSTCSQQRWVANQLDLDGPVLYVIGRPFRPKKFLSMSSQNVCLSEKVEILFLCVLFCHSEILLHSLNVRGADAI